MRIVGKNKSSVKTDNKLMKRNLIIALAATVSIICISICMFLDYRLAFNIIKCCVIVLVGVPVLYLLWLFIRSVISDALIILIMHVMALIFNVYILMTSSNIIILAATGIVSVTTILFIER
ncbi:MAG: hypothetical protein Q4G33_07890 [bacterium]|nr:hypothetical protein [bacterium]